MTRLTVIALSPGSAPLSQLLRGGLRTVPPKPWPFLALAAAAYRLGPALTYSSVAPYGGQGRCRCRAGWQFTRRLRFWSLPSRRLTVWRVRIEWLGRDIGLRGALQPRV